METVYNDLVIVGYKVRGSSLEHLEVMYKDKVVPIYIGFTTAERVRLASMGSSLIGRVVRIKCIKDDSMKTMKMPFYIRVSPTGSECRYNIQ